jgi:hypothetical protein
MERREPSATPRLSSQRREPGSRNAPGGREPEEHAGGWRGQRLFARLQPALQGLREYLPAARMLTPQEQPKAAPPEPEVAPATAPA